MGAPNIDALQNLLNQQKSTNIMHTQWTGITHHYGGTNELIFGLHRIQEYHDSSSDENGSSGHGSSPPNCGEF